MNDKVRNLTLGQLREIMFLLQVAWLRCNYIVVADRVTKGKNKSRYICGNLDIYFYVELHFMKFHVKRIFEISLRIQ